MVLASVLGLWFAGCSAGSRSSGDGGQAGGVGNVNGNDPPPPSGGDVQVGDEEIALRFINRADVPVAVEFHATNEVLDDPEADLFVEENLVVRGIGAGATGVLDVGQEATTTFPCGANTVLGTAGGEFRDPIEGTELASGQARVLRVDSNFDCGNTVIFTFHGADGEYRTEPPIVDFTD